MACSGVDAQPLNHVLLWHPKENFKQEGHRRFMFLQQLELDAKETGVTFDEWIQLISVPPK